MRFLMAAFALTFACMPVSASSLCDGILGNLVQNCGFEATPIATSGQVPTAWSGSQFTAFEAVQGTVVNSGSYAMRIANDFHQADAPNQNGAAILWQSFSDTPGEVYALNFSLFNGAPANSQELFQTFWGPQDQPGNPSGKPLLSDNGAFDSGNWTQYSYLVVGGGVDSLVFTSYNSPNYFYLDDVSLVDTGVNQGAAAPEPATWMTLMLGMGGAILLGRRAPGKTE